MDRYNELVELGYDDLIVITHSEEKYCKYADVKIEWKNDGLISKAAFEKIERENAVRLLGL